RGVVARAPAAGCGRAPEIVFAPGADDLPRVLLSPLLHPGPRPARPLPTGARMRASRRRPLSALVPAAAALAAVLPALALPSVAVAQPSAETNGYGNPAHVAPAPTSPQITVAD